MLHEHGTNGYKWRRSSKSVIVTIWALKADCYPSEFGWKLHKCTIQAYPCTFGVKTQMSQNKSGNSYSRKEPSASPTLLARSLLADIEVDDLGAWGFHAPHTVRGGIIVVVAAKNEAGGHFQLPMEGPAGWGSAACKRQSVSAQSSADTARDGVSGPQPMN